MLLNLMNFGMRGYLHLKGLEYIGWQAAFTRYIIQTLPSFRYYWQVYEEITF